MLKCLRFAFWYSSVLVDLLFHSNKANLTQDEEVSNPFTGVFMPFAAAFIGERKKREEKEKEGKGRKGL